MYRFFLRISGLDLGNPLISTVFVEQPRLNRVYLIDSCVLQSPATIPKLVLAPAIGHTVLPVVVHTRLNNFDIVYDSDQMGESLMSGIYT